MATVKVREDGRDIFEYWAPDNWFSEQGYIDTTAVALRAALNRVEECQCKRSIVASQLGALASLQATLRELTVQLEVSMQYLKELQKAVG